MKRWGDAAWWSRELDDVLSTTKPELRNLRITLAHAELSLALRYVIGEQSGANFHTWAVWGSKKAGRTIRREDLPWLPVAAFAAGGILGALPPALERGVRPGHCVGGAAVGALAATLLARRGVDRSARLILRGNEIVLDDIGRVSASFVCAFRDPPRRTQAAIEDFLGRLRPGPATAGGQDLLREAFHAYFNAATASDADLRDEQMLLGNLKALLHEHWRLEPYIDGALPRPLRRPVTARLLAFSVGPETLDVAGDVPTSPAEQFPPTLSTIDSPELDRFLDGPAGWDRTPNEVRGSGASDWTRIGDRMNYIVDLFRSRHLDPELFTTPYSASACQRILASRPPAEAL